MKGRDKEKRGGSLGMKRRGRDKGQAKKEGVKVMVRG